MDKKKCLHCNTEFTHKKNITCSVICRNRYIASKRKLNKYPKKVGICKECGKDIIAKNMGLDPKKRGRKFCNKTCQIIWQNKNIPVNARRRKILSDRAKINWPKLHTKEAFEKRRKTISGKGHWNWQDGKTKESIKIRNSYEYKQWRNAVFKRDNWTCVICGFKGEVEADHIKQFAYYPELRFDINNGRTLCNPCHRKTDTFANNSLKKNDSKF